MKIKILYIPQFSMNDGKQFFLLNDGNTVAFNSFMRGMDKAIDKKILKRKNEKVTEIENYVLTPEGKSIQIVDFNNIKNNFLDYPFDLSPIMNRYNFNVSYFKELFEKEEFDLIINNIPEISRNIRSVLNNKFIPMISINHFMDLPSDSELVDNWANGQLFNYWDRQIDSLKCSDLYLVNCESSLIDFKKEIKSYYQPMIADKLLNDNLTYWNYYVVLDDYKKYVDNKKFDKPTLFFPARITGSLYTHWVEIMGYFLKKGEDFPYQIIFANPSNDKGLNEIESKFGIKKEDFEKTTLKMNHNEDILVLKKGNVIIIPEMITRDQYIESASRSHIGVGLYLAEKYGGIAIREIMVAGDLIPMVPYVNEFKKWYKDVNEVYQFNEITNENFDKFLESINVNDKSQIRKIIDNIYKSGDIITNLDSIVNDVNKTLSKDNFK